MRLPINIDKLPAKLPSVIGSVRENGRPRALSLMSRKIAMRRPRAGPETLT
jgi:hypothetical protein